MNDPSAFPVNSANLGGPGAYEADPGMSLRDWFAGQALMGAVAQYGHAASAHYHYAEQAYIMADAMLAERAKSSPSTDLNGGEE